MKKMLFISVMFLSAPAFAHVTANPNHGKAGGYFETQLRVSHGCEGSDTVEVSVTLPAALISAKPQAKAGWSVEVKKSKLAEPVETGHGKMADERVDEIIWRGGPLKDSEFDTFGLLMKLPDAEGILWFPVKQVCTHGVEEWKNVPANMDLWGTADHPAPFVKIEEGEALAPSHHKH